jgi:hypothetical protein
MKKGSKQSPEAIEKMRIANLGKPSKRKGTKVSDVTLHRMREAQQERYERLVHPLLAARGITKEQFDEAMENGLKWCSGDCKAFVPKTEFTRNAQKCRKCKASRFAKWKAGASPERLQQILDYARNWRVEHPEYEKQFRLRHNYGVSVEWFMQTIIDQNGVCLLCLNEPTALRGFCVDHDHVSNKVRGLLCQKCNAALERVEAIPGWGERALAYLRKNGSL